MRYLFTHLGALALFTLTGCATTPNNLFNGHDFTGWELITTPETRINTIFKIEPGGVIATTGQPVGFIATTASYENYRLHFEWRWSGKPGNSGALVHISSGPKDRAWPLSLQIQTKNKNVGDILPMAGASFVEPLTSAPGAPVPIKAHTSADSEKAVGEWNTGEVLSKAGTIEVTINGVLQNKITQTMPHSGRIGFQLEGTPFELRNVTVYKLN